MLLTTPTIIIYLAQNKLIIFDGIKTAKLKTIPWDENDLSAVLGKYCDQNHNSTFHLILDPDASYTINIPKLSALPQRQLVFKELESYIPESITQDQFDWRILSDNSIEVNVIKNQVFQALLNLKKIHPKINFETQTALSLLLELAPKNQDLWFQVNYVTPIYIHIIKNLPVKNTYSYSSLPKDVKAVSPDLLLYGKTRKYSSGPDDKTLGVTITTPAKIISTPASTIDRKKRNYRFIFEILLLLILLIATPIYVIKKLPSSPPASTIVTTTPTPTPFVVPTPANFTITIQNSSGRAGSVAKYQKLLLADGFVNVTATNSANIVPSSSIYLKLPLPTEIQTSILRAISPLSPSIVVAPFDATVQSFESDILIIVGKNN
ncbi:MAG: LytR C-terminal domain-containing protein [bacterium]